jgi:hypothetical protein
MIETQHLALYHKNKGLDAPQYGCGIWFATNVGQTDAK